MKRKMNKGSSKKVFYHCKGETYRTLARKTNDDISQIKSDIRGNQCILDAVYNYRTRKMTVYSKRKGYTKQDYLANVAD